MRRKKQRAPTNSSNIWLLVSLLVLFFFVYQVSLIISWITLHCVPLERVWRPRGALLDSPFWLFFLAFILFGVWAVVEILASHSGKYRDRWFCFGVGLLAVACVVATLLTFRAHWEYYEVEWGNRTAPELTFQWGSMGSERSIDHWHEFLLSRQCDNPQLFERMSDAKWEALQKEFREDRGASGR